MPTRLLLITVLFFLAGWLLAQPVHPYEKKAIESYHARNYELSLQYCEQLIENDFPPPLIYFMAGESSRQLKQFELAEKYLSKVPDMAKTGQLAVTDFRLATVKKVMGNYREAIEYFEQYRTQHTNQYDALAYQAAEEIEYCKWANVKGFYPLYAGIGRLPENINSEHSDLAPLRFADKIYFTSTIQEQGMMVPVARIFSAVQDQPAVMIIANPDNPDLHAAHVSLMPDAGRMYYTLCSDRNFQPQYQCEIWCRDKQYEGNWGETKRLPDAINYQGYTATQPAVGYDRFLGKYVLFFVSDRPGGMGQKDIWCSIIEKNGDFGHPFPLPFNTPGDDVTPFFHIPSQTLFFSSDGLPGQGGFDIFRISKYAPDSWPIPVNLGPALNSEYDELYFTYHNNLQRGYFSSNRPGSVCNDHSPGCLCCDIFEASIFVDLQLRFQNAHDSTAVNGAFVEIQDEMNGTSEVFSASGAGNNLLIPLQTGKKYRIVTIAAGYMPGFLEITTENIVYFSPLRQEVYLFRDEALARGNREQPGQVFNPSSPKSGGVPASPDIEGIQAKFREAEQQVPRITPPTKTKVLSFDF